jgi:CRISPR-associated exonuclease Cas4
MMAEQHVAKYLEDELLPLSTLADLVFCERRAALHLVEAIWTDNVFTVEGTHLHQKVEDNIPVESRGNIRIVRGLRLRSLRLGLVGKTDVVEFHRIQAEDGGHVVPQGTKPAGIQPAGATGLWQPFPVEYKRGRLRHEEGYEVQVCAQALCLEEMLAVDIPAGALYYGKPKRRLEVLFDAKLRHVTETAALRLHELIRSNTTPKARYQKKCESCSLISLCLPKATGARRSVSSYLAEACACSDSD